MLFVRLEQVHSTCGLKRSNDLKSMNEELLHAITDLAYARFYYFRNSSRNHNINITQFLANESWFLMLLSRFPVERHTPQPRRRQYEIRTQRIDLTNAANLFDNLFPENINLEEFLQTPGIS